MKSCKHVCRNICAKSIRSILEPYSRYLESRGYGKEWRRSYVRVVEHFGRWVGRRRVCRSLAQQFLEHVVPNCPCSRVSRVLRRNSAALRHLLEMLGRDPKPTILPQGRMGNLLGRYQDHLCKVRGLVPKTIWRYLKYAHAMLTSLGVRRESQFKR